jgi:hypothetical protein
MMRDEQPIQHEVRTAVAVCQHLTLGTEATALLRQDLTPEHFVELLVAHAQFPDATRFLAHALPRRAAVWWACLCARQGSASTIPPGNLTALQAAERWVIDPCEANRRGAMQAAEAMEFQTAASWAAVAAFWSGGSLAPPEAPAVPPGAFLTAQAVAAAVMLAAVQGAPEKASDTYRTFLRQGLTIAAGTQRWPAA